LDATGKHVVLFALAGAGFGMALSSTSFLDPYGDLRQLTLFATSAPFSYLVAAAGIPDLAVPPLSCAISGLLLSACGHVCARVLVMVATLLQYLLIGAFLYFDAPRVAWTVPSVLAFALAVYVGGQVASWSLLFRPRAPRAALSSREDGYLRTPNRSLQWCGVCGFIYGLILVLADGVAQRLGNGSNEYRQGLSALLVLYSSPLGVLKGMPVLFWTPFWWGILGMLLARAGSPRPRLLLFALLAIHYWGVMFLAPNRLSGDWCYFDKDWGAYSRLWSDSPSVVLVGVMLYLLGQVMIWAVIGWHAYRNNRRARFGLRLGAAVLPPCVVLLVFCFWAVGETRAVSNHAKAAVEVRRMGGRLRGIPVGIEAKGTFMEHDGRVAAVSRDFAGYRASRSFLSADPGVYLVDLAFTCVGDADVARLEGLRNVYAIDCRNTKVTGVGLMGVKGFRRLRHVWVGSSGISEEGMHQIQEARPDILIHDGR